MTLVLHSPISGRIVALRDVPDPVFSEEFVGTGIAIDPGREGLRVVAPVNGVVSTLRAHAFSIDSTDRTAVLVHCGIDTIGLKGRGFTLLAAKGEHVEVGDPLIDWDPSVALDAGLSALVPVIIIGKSADEVDLLVSPGDEVAPGAEIARVRPRRRRRAASPVSVLPHATFGARRITPGPDCVPPPFGDH